MNIGKQTPQSSNPFSTRYVRPGAIPYQFASGQSAQELVERLADAGWRGQVVGPHGSGKSTLLKSLAGPLAAAGRRAWYVTLHDGARRMPAGWPRAANRAGANLLVIDGYEQLAWPCRFAVRARCRARGWGLLVTAHRDVGLPTLCATFADLATTQALVQSLLANESAARITSQRVSACFHATGGNVRETLFALYDCWEVSRPFASQLRWDDASGSRRDFSSRQPR